MSNLSNSQQIDQYFVALWQRCLDDRLREVQDGLWIAYEVKPSSPTSDLTTWHELSKEVLKSNFRLMDRCSNTRTVREKQSVERRSEKRKSQRKESKKKEDQRARKGRKVARHCVFPRFRGSGGSKSRLAKGRVQSHLVGWAWKIARLWHEAHCEVKMLQTSFLEHFWKLRCGKSARRCGAKRLWKSKC